MIQPTDDDLDANFVIEEEFEQARGDSEAEEVTDGESAVSMPKGDDKKRMLEEGIHDGNDEEGQIKKKKKNGKKVEKPIHKLTEEEQFQMVAKKYNDAYGDVASSLESEGALEIDQFVFAEKSFGKHSLESLSRYIRFLVPDWKKTFKSKNCVEIHSPKVIIVSSSALRAVELLKYLTEFQRPVAKIFARHMKINEQVQMLKSRHHPIAVGTPNRLQKLLESKAISLAGTSHVVLDMHKDSKNYTMVELKDTSKDVLEVIHLYLKPLMVKGVLKIGLY